MLGLYLGALAFGGVLVGASVIFGGDHGGDGDGGLGATEGDLDLGDGADAGPAHADGGDFVHAQAPSTDWLWLPFLSLRFWSFAAASFGAVGALLSAAGFSDAVAAPVAAVTGVGIGWSASTFFLRLQRDTVSGATSLERFVGEQARVVLAVRAGGVGTIRLQTAAGDVEVPATTRDRADLPAGSKVLVAGFHGRTADVTGLPSLPDSPIR